MGKSKRHRILKRLLPRVTSKDIAKSMLLQGFWTTAGLLYWSTLEGGDVEFLKDRASYFAMLLLACMGLIATAIKGTSALFAHSFALRLINWVCGGLILVYMLTRDLGTTLEQHGQYNFMIFMLMWQPVVLSVGLSKACGALRRLLANDRV